MRNKYINIMCSSLFWVPTYQICVMVTRPRPSTRGTGGNAPQSLWRSHGSNFWAQISLAEILAWPSLVPGCQKGLVHLQVGRYCNLFNVKCQTQLSLKTFTLSVTVNQSGQGKTRGLTVNTLTSLLGLNKDKCGKRTNDAGRSNGAAAAEQYSATISW